MFNNRRRLLAGGAAVMTAMLLGGCGSGSSSKGAENAITFAVPSGTPNVAAAGFRLDGQAPDYYAKEGLDLEAQYVDGANTAIQLIQSGKADVANGSLSTLLSAAAKDPTLRVIALDAPNVYHFVVPADSGIKSIEDLAGRPVGAQALSSASYQLGKSVLDAASLSDSVEWLPVGTGAQAAAALDSGDVDAYMSYTGAIELVGALTKSGVRELPSPLDGIRGASGFVTSQKVLDEKPEAIEKFLRGLFQSQAFTHANPKAAILDYFDAHPDQQPAETSSEEAFAATYPILEKLWDLTLVPADDDMYMFVGPESVAKTIAFLRDNDLVEGDFDEDVVIDLTLTKKANDFDRDAVAQDAKNWEAPKK